MISLFCPFCKHVFKVPDEHAGALVGCEQCKLEIRVPQPEAPPLVASGSRHNRVEPRSWWRRLLRRGELSSGETGPAAYETENHLVGDPQRVADLNRHLPTSDLGS